MICLLSRLPIGLHQFPTLQPVFQKITSQAFSKANLVSLINIDGGGIVKGK